MKNYILTYFDVDSNGAWIQRREEYPSRISAIVNYYFTRRNPRRRSVRLYKDEIVLK